MEETTKITPNIRDSIEDLLHEFDGVESKRIIADEIWNRILFPALWAGSFVRVYTGEQVCVGEVKHLGNATGPLVVVVPEEVTP